MARNGTLYIYTGTPGAGQATAMRAALAANLAYWTVGALYTFGAGTAERNYFVLTIGTTEILVAIPNGTAARYDNMIHANYRNPATSAATTLGCFFSFAPNGGHAAALAGAFDPAVDTYWEDIVVTQGKTQPTRAEWLSYWQTSAGSINVTFVEDNTREFLAIYSRRASVPNTYHMILIASDLYDNTYLPVASRIKTYGMIRYMQVQSGGPSAMDERPLYFWTYDDDPAMRTMYDQAEMDAENQLNTLAAGVIEVGGNFPTTKVPLFYPGFEDTGLTGESILGVVNPVDLRYLPKALSKFKQKVGTDANNKFAYVISGLLTPWDNAAANPA